jgi:hypothetical protein
MPGRNTSAVPVDDPSVVAALDVKIPKNETFVTLMATRFVPDDSATVDCAAVDAADVNGVEAMNGSCGAGNIWEPARKKAPPRNSVSVAAIRVPPPGEV